MENNKKYETLMQELSNENDALKQSVIIGRIIQDSIDKTVERNHRIIKWLVWLLALSIAVNVIIVGAFLWYESQMETATTTTTVEQDTGTGNGNAVYLSGESAQYHDYQPKKDGVNNGETESNNSDNNPQTQNQQQ